jgi:hypothetical protein
VTVRLLRLNLGRMPVRIGSIVTRCYQFDRILDFWHKALGYGRESRQGTANAFFAVPPGSLRTPRSSGATRCGLAVTGSAWISMPRIKKSKWPYRPGADFDVLEDPDGNLFSVVQKNPGASASGDHDMCRRRARVHDPGSVLTPLFG